MNCTELFVDHVRASPGRAAIWFPGEKAVSFEELSQWSSCAQSLCMESGLRAGDSVLLVDELGPRLFAIIIAVLALGGSVVLVEPWMPISRIERAVQIANPKIFLSNTLGKIWGCRIRAIRQIDKWLNVALVGRQRPRELRVESVPPSTRGIVTFTTGTTGEPKGVVRTQGYLVEQHRVLTKNLSSGALEPGTDLCIFANFALSNLAAGRGSLLMPRKWLPKYFDFWNDLPKSLAPATLTCGPAFLRELLRRPGSLPSLRSIHVGGATTDCATFERAFAHWPNTHVSHVYGSSEVEPVSVGDARVAVTESRSRGWFQTLALGQPVPEIRAEPSPDGLWVSGPHVCPYYLGGESENTKFKRKDAQGLLWHCLGDRILMDEKGWWFAGRSGQREDDFYLEQTLYAYLGSSRAFLERQEGGLNLVGPDLKRRVSELKARFPELKGVREGLIYRDVRHRARIDRVKSSARAGKVMTR